MTEATVTALVPQHAAPPPSRQREVRVVNDPIPVLDTARFEHMQRVANVMAYSSLVPQALTHVSEGDGDNRQKVALTPQEIVSNCFLVVNQAVRWGMDPFAVAQCVSVVHGKLCYEGKLIAAVINAKLGYDLEYEISGEGDNMKVVVTAALDGKPVVDSKAQPKKVEGTVAEWKTTGRRSPWDAPGGKPRMLRYRGAREWCRVHAPALMLGVYSDDEMEILSENDRRGHDARDVTRQTSRAEDEPPPAITHQVADAPSVTPAKDAAPADDEPPSPPSPTAAAPAAQKQQESPPAVSKPAQASQPKPDLALPEDGSVPDFLKREAAPKVSAEGEAPADAEGFTAWADAKLAAVPIQFAEAFEGIVDGEIRPRIDGIKKGMFPGDHRAFEENIEGIIRKHERRLNG